MEPRAALVQLLLLDHPNRLLSATVFATSALGAGLAADPNDDERPALPEPNPKLMQFCQHLTDRRDRAGELTWRVEHWRILAGSWLAFDADEFRRLEERIMNHAGLHDNPAAHARAAATGLNRAAELACVCTPMLVIEAPEDPINPPPHATHIARLIPSAQLVTVPGMGHALGAAVVGLICQAVLAHTNGF